MRNNLQYNTFLSTILSVDNLVVTRILLERERELTSYIITGKYSVETSTKINSFTSNNII